MSRRSSSSGKVQFHVVGLPDKAVAESRERVRAALYAIGLALPGKRLVVNLSPADLPKEGSHYDLPIALGAAGRAGRRCRLIFSSRYVVHGRTCRSTARSSPWPACCRRRLPPMPAIWA